MMKQHTNLLETIRDITGCEYMSDLRNPDRQWSGRLALAFEEIEVSKYSLEEWMEAAGYISGTNCHFESLEDAAGFLREQCLSRRTE